MQESTQPHTQRPALSTWWLCLFPRKNSTDRLPICWIKGQAVRWGGGGVGGVVVVRGQGQDTSCTGSNLQSVGSLVSDKNIVNQETKETPAWAACLYKTDRASTSVSHFVRIYTSWSKVPCLIIVEGQNPNQNWDCSIIAWLPYMAPRDHLSSESRLWLLKIDCALTCLAKQQLESC